MTSSNASVYLPHENRKSWCFFVLVFAALLLCANRSSAQTTSRSPGWVVITIGDYRTLHAKAYPPEREPEAPPVDATLTRVDYDLRIDGDLAAGRASLTVDVLKDGWVRVPIPAGPACTRSQTRRQTRFSRPWPRGKRYQPTLALCSLAPAVPCCSSISLCPSPPTAGEESISLPSTASGVTRASVRLPSKASTSSLPAAFSRINPNPAPKANGSRTLAAMSRSPSRGSVRPKITAATQALRLRGSLTELDRPRRRHHHDHGARSTSK